LKEDNERDDDEKEEEEEDRVGGADECIDRSCNVEFNSRHMAVREYSTPKKEKSGGRGRSNGIINV
jgi:hypothetical protein